MMENLLCQLEKNSQFVNNESVLAVTFARNKQHWQIKWQH